MVIADLASDIGAAATILLWIGGAALFSFAAHRADEQRGLAVGLYFLFGVIAFFALLIGTGQLFRYLVFDVDIDFAPYVALAVGSVVAGLILFPKTRRIIARYVGFSPQSVPDTIGFMLLTSIAIGSIALLYGAEDANGSIGYVELFLQAILLVALAFLAVGVFFRRSPAEAIQRLGLVWPTWKQVWIALGMVVVALIVAGITSWISSIIQPEVYDRIQDDIEDLTADFDSVWGALAIGLAAGIGEELLFRGAIQPRYGIVFTAIVFALLHIQYEASFFVLGVFAAGVVFGLERKYLNTTASIISHTVYNAIAVLATTQADRLPWDALRQLF